MYCIMFDLDAGINLEILEINVVKFLNVIGKGWCELAETIQNFLISLCFPKSYLLHFT